jgi:hypothetical protein
MANSSAVTRAVVLVEGISDQRAVEALADRRGRDLEAEGVSVVPIGGAHAIGHALERYGPRGLDLRLAGLYDVGEERAFASGLERAGLGTRLDRAELEELGFYACDTDLEHELVRAIGIDGVARIIEREGELGRFETFRKQLAKRDLPFEKQLWGFMWNRKIRYAPLLVEALDLDHVPRPLDRVLLHV